jgi:hypothetical protein
MSTKFERDIGGGWVAELLHNDRLILTHDVQNEVITIPPESTRLLIDICSEIMEERSKPNDNNT